MTDLADGGVDLPVSRLRRAFLRYGFVAVLAGEVADVVVRFEAATR